MSDRPTIKIKVPKYIKAFIINVINGGQPEPVSIPQKDVLSRFLNCQMITKPENARFNNYTREESIEIVIPYYEWHSPIVFNYLTAESEKSFNKKMRGIFFSLYIDFCNEHFINGVDITTVPHLFIKKYNLPDNPELENRLLKFIYRNHKKSLRAPKRSYDKKNNEVS